MCRRQDADMENNTILKVSGLKKRFGQLTVLKNIDLEVQNGEAISIIGPSGT